MADAMQFPESWKQFLHDYEFRDSSMEYTNGSMLVPSFRVEQMIEHYFRDAVPVARFQEREKAVVQLRKKWQAAEMFICTMCGHFDHSIDGNIVYGNKDCGEIVGYPCCKKFTPWISASVRLPKDGKDVLCWYQYFRYGNYNRLWQTYGIGFQYNGNWGGEVSTGRDTKVLFWTPHPEPPTEGGDGNGLD